MLWVLIYIFLNHEHDEGNIIEKSFNFIKNTVKGFIQIFILKKYTHTYSGNLALFKQRKKICKISFKFNNFFAHNY